MIPLALALLAGAGSFAALHFGADVSTGLSVTAAIIAFGVLQVAFGLHFRKRVTADMMRVQEILTSGQKRLQAKMARWQIRPPGSMKDAQREIAADTAVFVKEAIAATEALRRYRHWVPMIERQIATAQFQLNWMNRDFAAVDRLMKRAIFIDPTTVAMKMARLYMLDAKSEEIARVYAKGSRRLRYNQNVLLAATWSWILVRRGDEEGAFKVLTEALKSSDNATLRQNHEHLMNKRGSHFSNSNLGDQWYALMLEEPKMHAVRPKWARA